MKNERMKSRKFVFHTVIFAILEVVVLYYAIELISGNINILIISEIMRHFYSPAFFPPHHEISSSLNKIIEARYQSGMLFLTLVKGAFITAALLGIITYLTRLIRPLTKAKESTLN